MLLGRLAANKQTNIEHKLQTFFEKGQYFVATYQHRLNNNNNNNKSNLYSAIRHERYPHSAVHSYNVHTNAVCARMNLRETII